MRLELSLQLNENDFLLHADMWNKKRFPSKAKVINCGLGESNLLNVAAGLASENNTVFIYGVCGFIIHRYEQLKFSCRDFGATKGKIIICNAGKYGYEKFGPGHYLDDDKEIMETLKIPFFDPETIEDFQNIINNIRKEKNGKNGKNGIWYIRLGKDR